MQTDLPTMTAACEALGRHAGTGPAACKGVVLSLTEAHGTDCACSCHGRVRDLPDPWKAMAVLTPPCDQDAILDDGELDELLELEGDRLLELDAESRLFGAWS
jgi:hypothetical protein